MQMLKKIFKSDKKYYLELPDEITESKPVQTAVKTAEKVADAVQDKASEVLDSKPAKEAVKTAKQVTNKAEDKAKDTLKSKPVKEAVKTADKAKEEVKEKVESKTVESKTKINKKQKNAKQSDSKKPEAKAKPSPQDAGASSFEPPFWVAAMYNNSNSNVNSDGTQAQPTFATENLMPVVTKTRRRPGPSLNKFKDMAKNAKTPKG